MTHAEKGPIYGTGCGVPKNVLREQSGTAEHACCQIGLWRVPNSQPFLGHMSRSVRRSGRFTDASSHRPQTAEVDATAVTWQLVELQAVIQTASRLDTFQH